MAAAIGWWAAVIAWAGFIFGETWKPRPWLVPTVGDDVTLHLLGFGVLGVLLGYALRSVGAQALETLVGLAGLIALVLATVSEAGQFWVPGRGVELADWTANIGGAAAGIALAASAIASRTPDGQG